jgi:antitoxin CptB
LRWRCRRGLLEVDLLLQSFVKRGLNDLGEAEAAALSRLLECPDQELLPWLLGQEVAPDPDLARAVERIRAAAAG